MIFPLAGNIKIKESVCNLLKEKRLPHALLIEGDKGTGRHTLANFIALACVCNSEDIPCGKCNGCRLAKSHNHPDIVITAPEDNKKNIAVSQVRELKNETYIKPHMADKKVFIIDYADTLNEQSQNALLKVLEEPPGNTVFILIAESKASFLDTIISRCVVLTLSAPEQSVAEEYLLKNTNYSKNDISAALENSQNIIGKALSLLEGSLGTESDIAADEFLDFMLRKDTWGMLSVTAKLDKNRLESSKFFKSLKYAISQRLRKNLNSAYAKKLSLFYSELCVFEKSLDININLSLLFSAVCAKANEI